MIGFVLERKEYTEGENKKQLHQRTLKAFTTIQDEYYEYCEYWMRILDTQRVHQSLKAGKAGRDGPQHYTPP
jgi:hypothetical protein